MPSNERFRLKDRFGDEIALTEKDWKRIVAKRPDVEPYLAHVEATLRDPTAIYEGAYADSKVFYKKGLLDDDPSFTACFVVVVVRYTGDGRAASIRTVYFTYHGGGRLGSVLFLAP